MNVFAIPLIETYHENLEACTFFNIVSHNFHYQRVLFFSARVCVYVFLQSVLLEDVTELCHV